MLEQCLEIQEQENETHAIVSATRMKLGLIAMANAKVDQAMYVSPEIFVRMMPIYTNLLASDLS